MPLRLQVVSAHRESMGGAYIREFSACGGTIGRSLECDWALPDSKRYISSKHAMIDYQGKAYYLVDLSRNGVYVNGSNAPVGKGNPQRLFDGDIIRLGEFEIQVAIIDDPGEMDDDGMRDSVVRAQLVPEDDSIEMPLLPDEQINDAVAMDVLLRPGNTSAELSGLREFPGSAHNPNQTETERQVLQKIAADFLRTAGADPAKFRGIAPAELLQNAARVLSEFVEATHAMLASKDRISAQLKLATRKHNDIANPLRSADGIDNAIRMLLGRKSNVNLSGTEAVEAAFTELLRHQKAVISAMQGALDSYLEQFEPAALEQFFKQASKRTGSREAGFRDLYASAYEGLTQTNEQSRPQRFDAEFARVYELETAE